MRSTDHSNLNREEVIAAYNREFDEEYKAVVENIRSVAKGNTSFSNSWREWIAVGGISAGVIVTNATLGLLVALGVMSGFISLGVGLVVAVAGVVGSIAYRKYRINMHRAEYRDAENFIESEMVPENLEVFRTKMQNQLFPVLKVSTPRKINFIVKAVMEALENLIINRQVKSFDDLMANDMKTLLSTSMQATAAVKMDTKLIQGLIADLPSATVGVSVSTINSDTVPDAKQSDVSVSTSHQSFWNRDAVTDENRQDDSLQQIKNQTITLR